MRIGVPKEIKVLENRVGLTPAAVHELVARGHAVVVERNAGQGIGMDDAAYRAMSARRSPQLPTRSFAAADMIVKVKEPQRAGAPALAFRADPLHLPAPRTRPRANPRPGGERRDRDRLRDGDRRQGGLPLLAPMSEVAGRMSVQVARALPGEAARPPRRAAGGAYRRAAPGKVLMLGAGVVGSNAASVASRMGAQVSVLSRSEVPLRRIAEADPAIRTALATPAAIAEALRGADAVIGGALVPGALAPKLVTRAAFARNAARCGAGRCLDRPGRLLRDLARNHSCRSRLRGRRNPALLRGQYARRRAANLHLRAEQRHPSIHAALADAGWTRRCRPTHLRNGLNVAFGKVTCEPVAEALGYEYVPAEAVMQ